MFRFIQPQLDGSVIDIAIGAKDLQSACDQFADNWWRPEMTGAWAVFQNHALVARMLPVYNDATGDTTLMYREIH